LARDERRHRGDDRRARPRDRAHRPQGRPLPSSSPRPRVRRTADRRPPLP
jgi:hypothetical protein